MNPIPIALTMLIAVGVAGAAYTADDNPRGWPLHPDMTAEERAVAIEVMTLIEEACPPLREIAWAWMPKPREDKSRIAATVDISYPDPKDPWRDPTMPLWTAEISLFFDTEPQGPIYGIVAGGPERAALFTRSSGGYLGAEICAMDGVTPKGDSYRLLPALAAPLSRVAPDG